MEYQIELTGSRRTRLWCPIVEAMQMWLEGTWFWICILASRSRANLTLPPKIMGHAQVAWQLDSLLPPRITYSAKNASPPTDWQAWIFQVTCHFSASTQSLLPPSLKMMSFQALALYSLLPSEKQSCTILTSYPIWKWKNHSKEVFR